MPKAALFDLDGTLLPLDQDEFIECYFSLLAEKFATMGYEPKEFIDTIWKCVIAMAKNDGSMSNKDRFWKTFTAKYGEGSRELEEPFLKFYENEFQKARAVSAPSPTANRIVKMLKEAGWKVILATNPMFPVVATYSRVGWAELDTDDFDLITTYENISYSKPNPDYYRNIVERMGLDPEDCIMVGNDVEEDMIASSLGMDVFLLTDHMVNRKNMSVDVYPHGNMEELYEHLKKMI